MLKLRHSLKSFVINMAQLKLSDISMLLTDSVLERAFRLSSNSDDTIKSVEVTRAAPAGEGLIGAVYRVIVTGHRCNKSFIAKSLVSDLLLRRSLNCTIYFKRESIFYGKILPILVALQKSLNAKECLQNNVPICYGCHIDGNNDYILMEDLAHSCSSISGVPSERQRDDSLKVLAHIHAVSMALRVRRPDTYDEITNQLKDVYYNERNRDWYAAYLQSAIDIDIEILAQFENPTTSVYFKKFDELVKVDVYEQFIQLVSKRGENSVLCHGDAWLSNFLWSEKKAVAIDFQLFRCASPVTDLSYLIILCCNQCRCKDDFMKAVKVYYKALNYYLSDMGINAGEIFSWETLTEELKTYGKYGLLAALTSIPLMSSERCDVLQSFEEKYDGKIPDRIPLEDLWKLTPIDVDEQKTLLVNAVRVAVDVGLI